MKKTQKLNLSCDATFKDGTTKHYKSLEEASRDTGLSVNAIKIRCNKNSKTDITFSWSDEHTRRHYQAKKSKNKGNNYELQIIKELSELGFDGLKSSRSESKNLDNDKIDIHDSMNVLPFYIQCKNTLNTPNIEKITKECKRKDKPLAIFWKKVESVSKEHDYVLLPKKICYELLSAYKQINNKKKA